MAYLLAHVSDFNILLYRLKLEALLNEAVHPPKDLAVILITALHKVSPLEPTSRRLLFSLFAGVPPDQAVQVTRSMRT